MSASLDRSDSRARLASLFLVLGASLFQAASTTAARAQDAPAPGSREAMWPAPTAEDWKRPCLIVWQRTWEDAVALSKQTNKPILICVNMDGEIASEHYAGIRYRQPDIARLYEPYVCVIASVYRHTPRDYDEQGRRIPCPRFGRVTCGEHIAIEPIVYELYMDGQRVAPRHIMVETDGSESYDVYYAFDTDSVFQAIRTGIETRDRGPVVEYRGDKPLLEKVASRDSRDRDAVEEAFAEGDPELRRALLEAAAQHPEVASADLLRQAIFGLDVELAALARRALADNGSAAAVDLIADTLGTTLDAAERERLIEALERHGARSPRAATLATTHRGLSRRSDAVDAEQWARALQAEYRPARLADPAVLEARLSRQSEALHDEDPAAPMELAEAFLARALEQGDDDDQRILLLDAKNAAAQALARGAPAWRAHTVLSLSNWYLGDREKAYEHAAEAVKGMPPGLADWNSMAVLDLFAKLRWKEIVEKVRAKERWPREWLADIHAAHRVLLDHPEGTDAQVAWLYDRLVYLGAKGRAREFLERGLRRFPSSWILHDRLRALALKERGVDGLQAAYDALLSDDPDSADLEWFAGYASIVAAEFHRRHRDPEAARLAYDRAIGLFERSIQANPACRDTADHYIAVALGGRARVWFEEGRWEEAVSDLEASFARAPRSANALDGLNLSAVDTAKMLLASLRRDERTALADRVDRALSALDPDMLELPAYERPAPPATRAPSDSGR